MMIEYNSCKNASKVILKRKKNSQTMKIKIKRSSVTNFVWQINLYYITLLQLFSRTDDGVLYT